MYKTTPQNNKYFKKKDRDVLSNSMRSTNSMLEARISIHINDRSVPRNDYENIIRGICSGFGRIKHIHIPDKSKKGNLVFVEFCDPENAETAIRHINDDRTLHMTANPARAPKQSNFGQAQEQQPQTPANYQPRAKFFSDNYNYGRKSDNNISHRMSNLNVSHDQHEKENIQSWRSPRNSEQNRMSYTRNFHNKSQIESPQSLDTIVPNHGQCNMCQRYAELKCKRCGDFYCSRMCQKVHWPQHKRNCFPMPDLVSVNEDLNVNGNNKNGSKNGSVGSVNESIVSSISLNSTNSMPFCSKSPDTFELSFQRPQVVCVPKRDRFIVFCDDDPKNGDIVAITSSCSTNRVFIVQIAGKVAMEFREMLTWASREENHGPPFEHRPDKGTVVFAEYNGDWYRGLVQKIIDSENVLVALFDFGNAEQMHYTKLRQYTGTDDIIRYTYSVYLKDCPFDTGNRMPSIVAEYLKKFEDFTPLRLKYTGEWNRSTNVELYVQATNECINDRVCALLGTSRAEVRENYEKTASNLVKEAQQIDKFYYDDLIFERMGTVNRTRVCFLNTDQLHNNAMWCCLETANDRLKVIDEKVNEFAKCEGNLIQYIPEKNEICLIKRSPQHFERAVFIDTLDHEKAQVLSIDFGGINIIDKNSIFKLDRTLHDPIYTHQCRIENLPESIEGELYEYLKKELDSESFAVEKIIYDEEHALHILSMPHLLMMGVEDGKISENFINVSNLN